MRNDTHIFHLFVNLTKFSIILRKLEIIHNHQLTICEKLSQLYRFCVVCSVFYKVLLLISPSNFQRVEGSYKPLMSNKLKLSTVSGPNYRT